MWNRPSLPQVCSIETEPMTPGEGETKELVTANDVARM
jgi:hypothetical protein